MTPYQGEGLSCVHLLPKSKDWVSHGYYFNTLYRKVEDSWFGRKRLKTDTDKEKF